MKSAYKTLISAILAKGCTLSVFDGEAWPVKRATDYPAICAAIESVEEAQIRVRDPSGEVCGWALIIPGLDDGESEVADYTCNEFMNAVVNN